MIIAETERLRLRTMEERDIPRLVSFLNIWEVAKWIVSVPFPYEEKDAQAALALSQKATHEENPETFIIAGKKKDLLLGALALFPVIYPEPKVGDYEIGYWLGKHFWSAGYMTEAVQAILSWKFEESTGKRVIAHTNPVNEPSQNVLRKCGFDYLGIHPRIKPGRLRGSTEVAMWELTRTKFLESY